MSEIRYPTVAEVIAMHEYIVRKLGEAKLGGGPALNRGSIISPVVFNLLRSTAEKNSIPYTVEAAARNTSVIHLLH